MMRMRRGIMVFDPTVPEWKIWMGHQSFEMYPGMMFEIRIQNRYYEACYMSDYDQWLITLEDDVTFTLRSVEVYKIRVLSKELISETELPF